jgi:hypothetical protein
VVVSALVAGPVPTAFCLLGPAGGACLDDQLSAHYIKPQQLPPFLSRVSWPESSPHFLRLCAHISPAISPGCGPRSANKRLFDCITPAAARARPSQTPATPAPKYSAAASSSSPRDPRAPTYKYTPPNMADAAPGSEELYPIAVLIDELKVWR